MPAINTGRENTSARGRRAGRKTKKKYNVPAAPHPRPSGQSSVGRNAAAGRTAAKRERAKPAPTKSPVGDRNKDAGIRRGNRFKSSPKYSASVREAYRHATLSERQTRALEAGSKAKKDRTREDKAVNKAHRQRHKYDVEKKKEIGFIPRVRYAKYLEEYKKNVAGKGQYGGTLAEREAYQKSPAGKKAAAKKVPLSKSYRPSSLQSAIGGLPGGLVKRAGATIEATYHDPLGVPIKTAKQTVQAVPAAFGGAVEAVRHPVKTAEAGVHDFAKRNDESYAAKVKRIRKEGAFNDLADLATVVSGSGVAGAAKEAALARLGERAAVRLSGNVVKPRRTGGLVRHAVGRQRDLRHGAGLKRELDEARGGGREMDAVRHAAAVANERAGRTVQVAPRSGKLHRAQNRLVAKARGQGVYRLRHDQGARLKQDQKIINTLDKKEKRAFYYATQGIRTPEQAAELLPKLRAEIVDARGHENLTPKGSLKKSDMLPDIDKMLDDLEGHFTPTLSEAVEALRADAARAAHEDPRLEAGQAHRRRMAPIRKIAATDEYKALDHEKDALHEALDSDELHASDRKDAKDRLRAIEREQRRLHKTEADRLGLAEPLYFKSERYVGPTDFAARALGGKVKMGKDFRYKGGNLRVGLQDTSTDQFLRGKARNIKAKHNWEQIANMAEANRITELAPAQGLTIRAINKQAAQQGVDRSTFTYWNPGLFKQALADTGVDSFGELSEDLAGDVSPAVHEALQQATIKPNTNVPDVIRETPGWQAVPTHVMQELELQTRPSRAIARAWDAAKGTASRAILLTGNVPWATFQVASNVVMATAATGGRALNPANWLGTYKWWKEMSHDERNRIGAEIGLDTAGAQYSQTHLGASTNNHMVNSYRAFKASPFWHTGIAKGHGPSISQLNPAEAMASFDRYQNNLARLLTTYTGLKRDAARGMSKHIVSTQRSQDRLMHALGQNDVNKQVNALARDPHVLEQHAENVADWLGDYSNLTSLERNGFNRAIMFYPYMRYSLKLVFYTLPTKHPLVASILAELGQLHQKDLKKLLGGDGSNLYWDLGKVYFGKGGDVKSIDLRRANPALNALFDAAGMKNPKQLIGVLPPWAGWAANQMFNQDTFAGRDWRVHGKAAPYGGAKVPFDLGKDDARPRILLDDVLGIFYPYREAKEFTMEGPQGDDSLPWSPRPVKFKGRTYASKLQRAEAKKQQAFDKEHRSAFGELMPLFPQPTRDIESAKAHAAIDKAEKQGSKPKVKYFGADADGGSIIPKPGKKNKYFGAK